ncbi:MAG TPA: glutathione S-transferase family protein [Ramlibacter sp.]|jgi:glutathione S-transferase|nr:glutathione S-transferase family protein [Ramlibacter sp.]
MSEVILHHYPMSPYAEKARKALGIKKLAWRSVTIPVIMPKPDLMPLTGGYRKTPVMQIGADIYCDTQLILRELERRFPEPSLYKGSDAGTVNALSFYLDRTLFSPVVGLAFGLGERTLPPGFAEDRAKFSGRELDMERLKKAVPMLVDQLRPQFAWLEAMLVDGRAFLCGEHPTSVDCSAHHLCWFITTNVSANTPPLGELPKLRAWMQRMERVGHGTPTEMSSQDALAVAKAATPQIEEHGDANDSYGRKLGMRVQVTPDDSGRDPVVGELASLTTYEVVIKRSDPQVGDVAVHFPRAGFIIQPAP